MKKFTCVLLLMAISFFAFAQESIPIHGSVSDDQGQPLPGVTVIVKGTQNGTITDSEGQYSIKAAKDDSLIFTSLGFEAQTIVVGSSPVLNVRLTSANKKLNEVVVVSYGTQKLRNVTGSISQINESAMKDQPVPQILQKLQGKIAGVQINESTGRPGQGMSIRIRGAASINAGNGPLYVVDGQPLIGNINSLDPDEIATITVLKDASATALYGSRAANGVVLITTKQAKPGEMKVQLNAYYGIQAVPQRGRPDVMNGEEFAEYEKEYYEDKIRYEGWVNPQTGTATVPSVYQNPSQYGAGTNWYNVLLRKAPIQSYSVSVMSGSKKFTTAVTGGYFEQQGVMKNTYYRRYSFRANNEFHPNDKITLGFNIAPTVELEHNNLTNTDGTWQIIQAAVLTSPIAPAVLPDGTMPITATSFGLFPNPNWLRVLMEQQDNFKTTRLLGNAYLNVDIVPGLKFSTHIDEDLESQINTDFNPSTSVGGIFVAPPQPANGYFGSTNYYSWVSTNTLTYNKVFHHDHSVQALIGYTTQKYREYTSGLSGTGYPSDAIPWLAAATVTNGTSGTQAWTLESIIGRLNYSYKDKYLLSGAIRRDGSSRFGSARRWGTFPSVSAGWIVSDEPFMASIPKVNFFKIRASYGLTGNNNIGNYTSISLMSPTNYVFNNGLASGQSITSLGNAALTWETTKQFDIGANIGLFDNRIFFTYDYYHKLTKGLLYQVSLPQQSGFTAIQSNIGAFRIWGNEFAVSSQNLVGKLKWSTNLNISLSRNLVLKLGTNNTPIGAYNMQDDYWRTAVGHPMGEFFGFVFDGVYMTEKEFETEPKEATSQVGTVRMKDINHDDTITVADRTFIGNPNPTFTYGITNQFNYGNFDLNIAIAGAVGGKIFNGYLPYTENLDGVFNVEKRVANRWRSLEDPGKGLVPRTLAGTTVLFRDDNSSMVFSGSYLTVKNIVLGYTFNLPNNPYIKGIRIYGSIQQALVLTKYPGANPEVSTAGLDGMHEGVDQASYPIPRTYVFGVNMNF